MPLTAVPHTKLDDTALNDRIEQLYEHSPEFADGHAALGFMKTATARGDTLYLGMFNDNPIAAVGVFHNDKPNSKLIQYIIVHPANRGRGIATKFIKQVCDIEIQQGVQYFEPGCGALHRILSSLELLDLTE